MGLLSKLLGKAGEEAADRLTGALKDLTDIAADRLQDAAGQAKEKLQDYWEGTDKENGEAAPAPSEAYSAYDDPSRYEGLREKPVQLPGALRPVFPEHLPGGIPAVRDHPVEGHPPERPRGLRDYFPVQRRNRAHGGASLRQKHEGYAAQELQIKRDPLPALLL